MQLVMYIICGYANINALWFVDIGTKMDTKCHTHTTFCVTTYKFGRQNFLCQHKSFSDERGKYLSRESESFHLVPFIKIVIKLCLGLISPIQLNIKIMS